VQAQIESKMKQGVPFKNTHAITLVIDANFSNRTDAVFFVNYFMETHPAFAQVYEWHGEFWHFFQRRFVKSTVLKFVSKASAHK